MLYFINDCGIGFSVENQLEKMGHNPIYTFEKQISHSEMAIQDGGLAF